MQNIPVHQNKSSYYTGWNISDTHCTAMRLLHTDSATKSNLLWPTVSLHSGYEPAVQISPSHLMNDVLSTLNALRPPCQSIHNRTVLKTVTSLHSRLWHDQQCTEAKRCALTHVSTFTNFVKATAHYNVFITTRRLWSDHTNFLCFLCKNNTV